MAQAKVRLCRAKLALARHTEPYREIAVLYNTRLEVLESFKEFYNHLWNSTDDE